MFKTLVRVFRSVTILGLTGAAILLLLMCFVAAILPAPQSGHREACLSQMRQISMALQTYATNNNGQLPPAYIADENGRPMHSWRVLLLPYLEQQALYDRYNFDEPWNGPNNSKLAAELPGVYQCLDEYPRGESSPPSASYVVVVGPNTLWPGSEPGSLDRIPDGSGRTLLLVEIRGSGIHWMEPRDLTLSEMNPRINGEGQLGISSMHPGVAHVMFADGHGASLSKDLKPDTLRQLIQIDDGAPSYTDF